MWMSLFLQMIEFCFFLSKTLPCIFCSVTVLTAPPKQRLITVLTRGVLGLYWTLKEILLAVGHLAFYLIFIFDKDDEY